MTFEKPKTGCPKRNIKMIHFSSYINISRCHVVRSEAREIGRGRKRLSSTVKEWWKLFFSPSRFIQLFSQHGGRRRRPFPTFAGRLNRLNAGSYMAYKTTCNDEVLRVFFFYFNDIWMSKHTYVYFLFFQKNYDKKIGHVEIAQFSIVSFFLFINFFFITILIVLTKEDEYDNEIRSQETSIFFYEWKKGGLHHCHYTANGRITYKFPPFFFFFWFVSYGL